MRSGRGVPVRQEVYVVDRAAFMGATELIARYGAFAGEEASSRADRSRSLGNIVHFCHWRQIERAIEMLRGGAVTGSIH
jgi:hypothetical protein